MLCKIVDCGAAWCGPCKMFSGIFDEVSKMEEFNGIEFKGVDVDTDEGNAYVEKYGVRNIPTILFLDENDRQLERQTGSVSRESFVSTINKILKS